MKLTRVTYQLGNVYITYMYIYYSTDKRAYVMVIENTLVSQRYANLNSKNKLPPSTKYVFLQSNCCTR